MKNIGPAVVVVSALSLALASTTLAAPAQRNVPVANAKAVENAARAGINLQNTVMSDAGGGNGKEQVSTTQAPKTTTTTSTVAGDPIITYGPLVTGDNWVYKETISTGPIYFTDTSGNNASHTPPANGNFKQFNDVTYVVVTEKGDTTRTVSTQETEVTSTHTLITQTTTYEEIDPGKSQRVNQAKEEAADPDVVAVILDETTTSDPVPVGEAVETTETVQEGGTTTSDPITEAQQVGPVCNNGNNYCS